MLRIAFVHNIYPMGGGEDVTAILASYLHDTGRYDCYLLARVIDGQKLRESDRRSLHLIEHGTFFTSRKAIRELAAKLDELKIDLLVIPFRAISDWEYLRKVTRCKIIYHHHGLPRWEVIDKLSRLEKRNSWSARLKISLEQRFHYYSRRFYQRIYPSIYRSVDRFVVLCDLYRHEFEQEIFHISPSESKIRTQINPLKPFPEVNLQKNKEVLYLGRMTYADKRVDRLLRIWAEVEPQFPDWELKLVGDGDQRPALEEQARALGLKRARFCGYSTRVAEHYSTAAILCMTSTFEGWPLVLVEAQANGVVPIAFDSVGGITEIIGREQPLGVLVEPFDEEAYTRELINMMRDGERRKALQPLMLAKTREYSAEQIGRRWEEMIQEIMKE